MWKVIKFTIGFAIVWKFAFWFFDWLGIPINYLFFNKSVPEVCQDSLPLVVIVALILGIATGFFGAWIMSKGHKENYYDL